MPEFEWGALGPGRKGRFALTVREGLTLPVLAVRGAQAGRTLLVSAGVHGDEYEGIQAIFDVFEALDPNGMHGSLITAPIANPPAFWNGTRTSPLDGGNLARMFPGDAEGGATQAIAWHFDRRLLALADFYLDLHSAGVKWLMPTLVGYHAGDPAAEAAAEAFGAPVVWRHTSIAPGRTVSAAAARGLPSLYVEGRGAGRIHPDDLAVYRDGILRLMGHLGITRGEAEPRPPRMRLAGGGNIDEGVLARQRGFLTPRVELLQHVTEGELLGTLHDEWGRTLDAYHAPRAGVVVLIHACPLVAADEPLFLITGLAG